MWDILGRDRLHWCGSCGALSIPTAGVRVSLNPGSPAVTRTAIAKLDSYIAPPLPGRPISVEELQDLGKRMKNAGVLEHAIGDGTNEVRLTYGPQPLPRRPVDEQQRRDELLRRAVGYVQDIDRHRAEGDAILEDFAKL
ncbi:MAG: hypothetical protein EBS48_05160 [Actinobacteria bacterium]|nr:hypothetical protein [Actinomycetota bacterium]